jgi:hypothetical protein
VPTINPSASDLDIIAEVEREHGSQTTDSFDFPDDADETTTDELETEETETPVESDAEPEVATPREDATPVEEPDPLATAPALKYTVDGQEKEAGFAKVFTDKDGTVRGAFVDAKDMPTLQQRLSRADYYEAQNKSLYEKTRQYESLGGVERVQSLTTENAKLSGVVSHFAEYLDFDNPQKLIALAIAAQDGDKAQWDSLVERTKFIAEKAAFDATKNWGTESTKHVTQQNEQEQRAQVTTQSIANAVEHWSTQYAGLTAEDKAKAIAHFNKIGSAVVRPASPEEARTAGVSPGTLIIDHPVIAEYLSERAELRKAAASTAKAATTTERENRNAILAAQRGKQTKTRQTNTRQATPAKSTEPSYQDIKRAALNGKFLTSVVGDADDE